MAQHVCWALTDSLTLMRVTSGIQIFYWLTTHFFILVSIEAIQSVPKKYGSSIPSVIVMLQLSFPHLYSLDHPAITSPTNLQHVNMPSVWWGQKTSKREGEKKARRTVAFSQKHVSAHVCTKNADSTQWMFTLVDSERTVWENTCNCCKIYVHLLVLYNR